ncbi:MAG: S8 family serine peptidase [Deltaproteobacteria bacterium]|nr:S8 family serine peptidase [Deltaproteobacteria bacterium]
MIAALACDGAGPPESATSPTSGAEQAPPAAAPATASASLEPASPPAAPSDASPKVPFVAPEERAGTIDWQPGVGPSAPDVVVHTPDGHERVRVLVRFAPGAERAAAYAFIDGAGARVAARYRLLPDLVAVRELPARAVDALARAPGVVAVLPDRLRRVNLAESRAVMNATPTQLAGLSDGAGVRVCVLDTGLNKGHPAFAGAVVAERDFVNGDNDATDDEGHGTNVAGIIASRDATYGGVAPGASLIIGKVLAADGGGYDSDIIDATEWCTLDVGADVINMSLGGGKYFGTCDFDALAAAVNASVDAGVVNVIAAGNEGYTNATGSPGCARRAITVAAVYDGPAADVSWCLNASCSQYCTDTGVVADKRVCFSNQALKVDVAAPGSEIEAPDGLSSGYSGMSGTSQATPHVAGLVARLLGERPELRPNDVRAFLDRNALDLGAAGFDVGFGAGRVDALATLEDDTAVTCASAAACGDADPCTVDVCQGGACAHRPACDDGTAATTDTCVAGACSHAPVVVDDGRSCTTDTLDACLGPRYAPSGASCHATCGTALPLPIGATIGGTTSGATKNVNLACPGYSMPGADVMYRLWLRPEQPVTIALTTTASWDPAIYLLAGTSASACDATRCVGGMDVGVSRQGETMERVRVPVAGWYFLVVDTYASSGAGTFTLSVTAACDPEDAGRACDDGNACTTHDVCVGTVCQGGVAPPECVVDADCADGDACNGVEACVAGRCEDGVAPGCDDGEACTTDGCDPASGCTHVALGDGASCADGTVCNGDETCLGGVCGAGAAPVCDDGDPCTTDGCHPVTGCQSAAVADGTACDDGDACNGIARCASGVCTPEAPPSCDDGDACTIDGCHAATGCTHAPLACDDGDPCDGVETCDAGGCVAGAPPACDDGTACTSDTCLPGVGCLFTAAANGSACSDGDACTADDTCQGGACASGANVCARPSIIFGVSSSSVTLPGGLVVNDEDLVRYDLEAGTYHLYFDGSDVGVTTGINNLAFDASGDLVLSFRSSLSLGGTTIDTRDLVRFTPTSLGATTAGSFAMYFDGSDVGLTQSGEVLDAVVILADGSLLVSTTGGVSAGGVSGAAQDLLRFVPTTLGASTSGTWSMYLDGSDVGLSQSSENIDAVSVLADGSLLLSTTGSWSVTGVSGANEDVLRFVPTSLGSSTAGTFSLYLDGSANGFTDDARAAEWRLVTP